MTADTTNSAARPGDRSRGGVGIDVLIDRLARQPFRARFALSAAEVTTARTRGPATIAGHAADLIGNRLAPAAPANDGKQTPYRGHPVFVAQHATATCCRTCLHRWHHIDKGRPLTAAEQGYVVDVIMTWLRRQLTGPPSP